jgi:hypothetical protein
MKPKWMMAVALAMGVLAGQAQTYWVVETTPQTKNTIVRIYDEKNQLLQEETIYGRRLDVRYRGDRKLIDRRLKEMVKHKTVAEGKSAKNMRRT